MNRRIYDVVDDDPKEHIRTALALLTLSYHNKNYLDSPIKDNCTLFEELQYLLIEALKKMEKKEGRKNG